MQVENGSVEAFGSRIVENVSRVLVGKEAEIELCVIALLSRGHLLIEDVPGVGKTMLAKSLARSLGCLFERLQFTPDLLPSDVTGVNIYSPSTQQFEFRQGPIFTQVLLADEINRATPKTQSALLEPIVSAADVLAAQKMVQEIYVDDQLKEYIARVTHRTRSHADIGLGASSRGSLGLFRTAQARAALEGRDFVTPDDVKALVHPVLAHRLILKANAELRGLTPVKVLNQILESEPVPPPNVVSRYGRRVAS